MASATDGPQDLHQVNVEIVFGVFDIFSPKIWVFNQVQ